MAAAEELSSLVGVKRACQDLSRSQIGALPAPLAPAFSAARGRVAVFGAPSEGG